MHLSRLYSLAAALSLSTNVAFTALHAQHVAFRAHLERISPFPGPAQAQGYIDMPCYGGGFSFFFLFFSSLVGQQNQFESSSV